MTADATFTKTEALARLRTLAAEAKRIERLPRNASVQLGTRTVPVVVPTFSEDATWIDPDDDLSDTMGLDWAASTADANLHGAVVHLYLYENLGPGNGVELRNVVTAWMGTPTEPPRLVHVPG